VFLEKCGERIEQRHGRECNPIRRPVARPPDPTKHNVARESGDVGAQPCDQLNQPARRI
jgi:hypothetical protein